MDTTDEGTARIDSLPGLLESRVAVILLGIMAVALVVIAVNSHRLVIEQQRTTCYERLTWLSPGEDERPVGVERSSSARLCEGSSPLIEFREGQ